MVVTAHGHDREMMYQYCLQAGMGRLIHSVVYGRSFSQGRTHIFKIHARSMSVERDIRYELLARLCPNSTGVSSFVVVVAVLYDTKCGLTVQSFSVHLFLLSG